MAGAFGESLPPEATHLAARVKMAQETGWTFEQIDRLSLADWWSYWAVSGAWADLRAFRAS